MIQKLINDNPEIVDRKLVANIKEIPGILKKFKRETLLISTEKGRVIANLCAERNKIKNDIQPPGGTEGEARYHYKKIQTELDEI